MAKRKGGKGFTVAVLAEGIEVSGKRLRKSIAEELKTGRRKPPLRATPAAPRPRGTPHGRR